MDRKRIIIAGGSGFIGRALVREFLSQGFEVAVLTRSPRQNADGAQELEWDGFSAGAWAASLDGAEAIINLTGKSINCQHTPENLREITDSRVNSVKAIAAAVRQVRLPPRVWVQTSATGFYGDTGDRICDEDTPAGNGALAEICKEWEGAFATAALTQTRKVCLRIGFVLGCEGGALPLLGKMTRLFLGGAAGSGRQYVSWVHLTDLVAMFKAATVGEPLQGVFNAVAPNAITNAELMRELRRVLHRPWSPPVPAFAVKLGARLMGSEGSLALVSQRAVPKRFQEAGFSFRFNDLGAALKDLCAKS